MSRALRRTYLAGRHVFEAELRAEGGRLLGRIDAGDDPQSIDASAERLVGARLLLEIGGRTVRAAVFRDGDRAWVAIEGRTHELVLEEPGGGATHHAGEEDFAISPMTGTLVKVAVEPGAAVAAGGELFVVEAMKMEYVVRAPRDLVVAEVRHAAGEQVDQGRVVVAFEAAP